MMARHVMLAWYMCSFEIFYGIWNSIAKKLYFCDLPGGGSGPPAPPPPTPDLPMIRLLPSAKRTVSILGHSEWWY